MSLDVEKVITDKAEETRKTFRALLDKTNKEHPNPKDVKALSDLLGGNRKLEALKRARVSDRTMVSTSRMKSGQGSLSRISKELLR
ncbi:MAG TPA: hypothetical protein VFD48_08730 [Pyrinomonadaceae bacterium]|nr:hypothetical protein [Pyrinomonadaceae bacterium]